MLTLHRSLQNATIGVASVKPLAGSTTNIIAGTEMRSMEVAADGPASIAARLSELENSVLKISRKLEDIYSKQNKNG